ncbi:MAG TPA: hypothetical protein VM387_00270, partial [Gemmatimonadales bacterium]|nr:hypothetical protein [Gemmatimonadales bacterium]
MSLQGGAEPAWAHNGRELFYRAGDSLMAASVTLSPDLKLGPVTKLFPWEKPPRGITGRLYDMSPVDGRFLITKATAAGSDETI